MRSFEPQINRGRLARGATLALVAAVAGCGMFRRDEQPRAERATTRPVESQDVQTYTGAVPGVLQPMNRPILQGPLPLIYLTESPGTLRITNVNTGEEIAVVDVKAMQILRVEGKGVVLANETVLGATLAPGTYAITPLSDNAGVVRTEQIRVRPTAPSGAASRPAAETQPPTPPAPSSPPAPTADTPPPQ